MDDVGDLFNELYHICKDKYNEEKDGLITKDTKKFNYTKLRLTDDYQCLKKNKNKPGKNLIKKNPLKNQQKLM